MKVIPVRVPDLKGPLGRDYLAAKLNGRGVNLDLAIYRAYFNFGIYQTSWTDDLLNDLVSPAKLIWPGRS